MGCTQGMIGNQTIAHIRLGRHITKNSDIDNY